MPKTKNNKLTQKQQKFVDEYLIDLNATQAAIRAGYSAKTAEWIGPQLLGKSHVAAAIKARRDELSRKTEVTQERIILEMSRLAFMDIRSLFNADGSLIPIKQLSDSAAAAIAGIDVVQVGNSDVGVGHVMKYKFPDKNKALENLARILGYFDKDKNKEQDGISKLADALTSLANRLPT
ncbi:MAG: terminase small subunit [Nitrosomonas sp.]|nr:terminase small subunit [Nitrosomonas sp.]